MAKFCETCGASLLEGAKFCNACGHAQGLPLLAEKAEPVIQQLLASEQPTQPQYQLPYASLQSQLASGNNASTKRTKKLAIPVIGMIMVFIGAFGLGLIAESIQYGLPLLRLLVMLALLAIAIVGCCIIIANCKKSKNGGQSNG